MPRVKGPLFSMEASGSLKKSIIYSHLRKTPYVKSHVIPYNPKTTKQTNMRVAFTLCMDRWPSGSPVKVQQWTEFGEQFNLTGRNIFMRRGLNEYIIQLGVDTTPTSVNVIGAPPNEIWTWA